MDIPPLTYSFISSWTFECFHLLALVNSAASQVCVHVFVWTCVFTSLACTWKSEMEGCSGRLESPCEFYDQFVNSCKKKSAEILIGIVLSLYVNLGK